MIALLAALMAFAAPAEAARPRFDTVRATIVSYGPMPPDSGVFAFYRDITVRTGDQRTMEMVVLWMSSDQAVPAVGEVCDIGYRAEPMIGQIDKDRRPIIANVVETFDCER